MRDYIVRVDINTYRISLPETPFPGAIIFGVGPSVLNLQVLNVAYRPGNDAVWLECEAV